MALAGCSDPVGEVERFYDSKLTPDRPIDWWHQLQGGPVAQTRPPPPGAADPYPSFAAIPPRPTPIDPATRRALLTRMIAQRDQAQRAAARDPLAWPPPNPEAAPKPAPPVAAAPAPAPAPGPAPDANKLVFDAAAPAPAQSTPAPAPAVDPQPPAAFARRTPIAGAAPVPSGPIPALPQAAPALPVLPGLPTATPEPVIARPLPQAAIRFPPASSALSAAAEARLRDLAQRRAGSPVAVTAGGDASDTAPDAQRRALPLALRRAGAITAALVAAGVPAEAIRTEATAQGRDAAARLLQ